jgi:uncharacterized protein YdeI (YjbR/CyaY-like superfamily)
MSTTESKVPDIEVLTFARQQDWAAWLDKNHGIAHGVWLRFAKKGADLKYVSRDEALEVALCYGWIDGQAKSEGNATWLQRFVPRARRSIWSKINREKALALIEGGRMQPTGLAEVERARRDGRWDAAYDSPANATVPEDLQRALNNSPRAKAFFTTLDSRNRYAILFRLQTVKKQETRARRISQFIEMLEKNETIYP